MSETAAEETDAGESAGESAEELVVRVDDLSVDYRSRDVHARCTAIDGVTLEVAAGELLGVVGESGSGKSTLAACIALQPETLRRTGSRREITGGSLEVFGVDVGTASGRTLDRLRLRVGHLAQDAAVRLDQRLTVAENVAEPIYARDRRFPAREAGIAVVELVDAVRLPLAVLDRYPYELSSGQRQRVALARALVLGPELLVADEPTRGVDAVVRGDVLEVIRALRRERGFSAIIVSSDLGVITALTDRVAVLHRGHLIGLGGIDEVLDAPVHPYLRALAASRDAMASGTAIVARSVPEAVA